MTYTRNQWDRIGAWLCVIGGAVCLIVGYVGVSGNGAETKRFGGILREIIARRGTGILLVEHDMSLVMDVCDHLYVIDFGLPIFEGTPAEVRHSDIVRAAYLGSHAVEEAV